MKRWSLLWRRFKYLIFALILVKIFINLLPSPGHVGPTTPHWRVPHGYQYPKTSPKKTRERWEEYETNLDWKRLEEVKGWEKEKSRNVKVYVTRETTLKHSICSDEVYVMIFVFSAPESFARRDAIRKTWAITNANFKVAFLLGKSDSLEYQIEQESKQYGDIIQEDFIDSYQNMTIKSILMLKWFLGYCPTAHYMMKTDDDMVVIPDRLAKTLHTLRFPRALLFGLVVQEAKPFKNPNHKWYVPKYIYGGDVYPDFLSGKGYVVSKRVAMKLYTVAMKVPIVNLEDVYVTGICAEKAEVRRSSSLAFSYFQCDSCLPFDVITCRIESPKLMKKIWAYRENCSQIYPKPFFFD